MSRVFFFCFDLLFVHLFISQKVGGHIGGFTRRTMTFRIKAKKTLSSINNNNNIIRGLTSSEQLFQTVSKVGLRNILQTDKQVYTETEARTLAVGNNDAERKEDEEQNTKNWGRANHMC